MACVEQALRLLSGPVVVPHVVCHDNQHSSHTPPPDSRLALPLQRTWHHLGTEHIRAAPKGGATVTLDADEQRPRHRAPSVQRASSASPEKADKNASFCTVHEYALAAAKALPLYVSKTEGDAASILIESPSSLAVHSRNDRPASESVRNLAQRREIRTEDGEISRQVREQLVRRGEL
jgi:hypothetical protein